MFTDFFFFIIFLSDVLGVMLGIHFVLTEQRGAEQPLGVTDFHPLSLFIYLFYLLINFFSLHFFSFSCLLSFFFSLYILFLDFLFLFLYLFFYAFKPVALAGYSPFFTLFSFFPLLSLYIFADLLSIYCCFLSFHIFEPIASVGLGCLGW